MAIANLPLIPSPDRLLDLLVEYPELIQDIRDTLERYLKKPNILQPLDGGLWFLEDTLSDFVSKAQDEVDSAEVSGNAEAITNAKAKVSVMFRARSPNGRLQDIGSIVDYCKEHEEAF